MIAPLAPSDAQIRDQFVSMLPELSSRLNHRFADQGVERREEHVAEAIALSWHNYLSACRKGKNLTASNLAWAAGKGVLAGRRLAGSNSTDALSQHHHGPEFSRLLDESDCGGDGFYKVFADRRWRWPIVDYVAARVDLAEFRRRCTSRARPLIDMKLAGIPQVEIAEALGVSAARVCQRLRELRRRWQQLGAA